MGRSRSAWSFLANLPSITTKGKQFVETREALQAVARREKLDQQTIKQLHGEGYIEVCDACRSPNRCASIKRISGSVAVIVGESSDCRE